MKEGTYSNWTCYRKSALAVEQDGFGFVSIEFKVVGNKKKSGVHLAMPGAGISMWLLA